MLKNYFKIAWRSLWKNKFYTVINISGLAVGLATGIMLLLWVQNELSFDKFHKDYQNIYELSAHFKANGKELTWKGVPGPLAVYAKSIPQVKSIVRINSGGGVLSNADNSKIIDGNRTAYIDSCFLSIFNFKLLEGNKSNLFPDNNSIVVTQSTAEKFFGTAAAAMGKVIVFQKNNFTVSGILQNFPENSSLQYDAIFPMEFYAQQFTKWGGNGDWKTIDDDLGNYAFQTYVELQPGADPEKIGKDFSVAYKKARNGESETQFKLQNLAGIHLVGADDNDSALKMVQIFMLVAILLLLIAGINYVNLSTARSLIRAKEVSIRKIAGANKTQLFFRFITETFLLFCMSTIVAIVLIVLLMPFYNRISGKDLQFSLTNGPALKVICFSIIGTLIAASVYPAIVLSSFHPIQSLKGKVTSAIGAALFRKMLVVFQFAISVVLIISTLVIGHQMKYVRKKNLGYDKSYVFSVPLADEVFKHLDAVKNELSNQPGILNMGTSDIYDMSSFGNASGDIDWPGKPANNNMIMTEADIDKNFIPTMKIQFLEGRNFSGLPADSAHYILNEKAVKKMGLKPPYVGQQISSHNNKGIIIGVVKDFNFKSLKEDISPFLFFSRRKGYMLYVRTTAKDAQQAIATTEKQYKKYAGTIPFSYSFIDQQFEAQYKSEQRAGILFNVFAGIAIFISCLGLFGLATYTAQVKTKEIGIRKVLGATVGSIVQLISKDFVQLVIAAIIIATPVAWWAMNKWLQGFAYRVNISWWVFAFAGLLALLIALTTVSYQAIKAAVANPVKSLRSE